jgi:predicted LPLAT superfamily acyltransferase
MNRTNTHWTKQKEVSSGYAHFKLMLMLIKFFPLVITRLLVFPVSFFYFIFCKNARVVSKKYLINMRTSLSLKKRLSVYKHILSFSLSLIDKLAAWCDKLGLSSINFHNDDIDDLVACLEKNQGAMTICSHLGNSEMLRALAQFGKSKISHAFTLTLIGNFAVTENFNKMLKELNPDAMTNIINANDINMGTIGILRETVSHGGVVVISGDRTSPDSDKRCYYFDFLGKRARWGEGPFYLAALLKAPVYFIFGLRAKDIQLSSKYDMYVIKSKINFDGSRAERKMKAKELAGDFVGILENYCKQHPYQWYNFYDFWEDGITPGEEKID